VRRKPCSNRFAKALTKRVLEEELAALEALMPKLGVEDGDEPEGAKNDVDTAQTCVAWGECRDVIAKR
jgi:hypothetical protein